MTLFIARCYIPASNRLFAQIKWAAPSIYPKRINFKATVIKEAGEQLDEIHDYWYERYDL